MINNSTRNFFLIEVGGTLGTARDSYWKTDASTLSALVEDKYASDEEVYAEVGEDIERLIGIHGEDKPLDKVF